MTEAHQRHLPPLVLRPLRPSDADRLFDGLRDPSLYDFLEERPPESLEGLRERYRFLAVGAPAGIGETWLNWVVEDPGSGAAVGTAQATIHDSDRSASIAYVLLGEWWGRGLASAAVAQMLGVLAAEFDVTTAQAEIHEENQRSIRVVERNGFVRVDTVREDGYNDLIYARAVRVAVVDTF